MIANHRAMGGTNLGVREVTTVVAVAMTNTTSLLLAEATSHLSLIMAGLMVVEVAISIAMKSLNTNHRRGKLLEDKSTITITVTPNHHLSRRGTRETTNKITIATPTVITTTGAVAGTTTSRRTISHRVSPPTTMRTRSTPKSFPR
jgi:hypothetical protein